MLVTLALAAGAVLAQEVSVSLPRQAWLRGETIPIKLTVPDALKGGRVEVLLGDLRVVEQPVGDGSVAVPTAGLRVGDYALKALVRAAGQEAAATADVSVVKPLRDDRLDVWLWTYGGGFHTFYPDHGFTVVGGPVEVYYRDEHRASYIRELDQRLKRGARANLFTCGGIAHRELKELDRTAEGIGYQGAGRHEERFVNPFAPEVEKLRAEKNQRLMSAVGWHPAIKIAFFNTELVDDLWFDNLNPQGVEQTKRVLGFTRDERGEPKYVAPGVLADDDRGYAFQKYVYQRGNGLAHANQRTAADIKAARPDLLTLTDPYRQVAYRDMFPGLDLVGTWTYTNNDPKMMLYTETLRALTRGTDQGYLQTVTLLNYPGTLVPRSVSGESSTKEWFAENPNHRGWTLMGPGRCREVSWIILSRAPKMVGYYYSSACDPVKYDQPEDQQRVPRATSEAIRELSERVYRPYGPMITRLNVARRRIAVLSSQAARLYGKSPRGPGYANQQIYDFYAVLAMCHLDGDVLFDEHLQAGALKDYDVLFMPRCDVITKSMHDEVLAFVQRGGLVVADQYLGAEVPGAIRFECDFSYRLKVNADAIESGVMFAEWDDQLNPKTAKLAEAKGITAEDDQKIMESVARRLKKVLAGKVEPEISADSPRALVNLMEGNGVKYLAVINDNRTYDERVGRYQAILGKLVPHTVTIRLRSWSGPLHPYDLVERKALPATRDGDGYTFKVDLTELGGKLVALYPLAPAKIAITTPAVARGATANVRIAVQDAAGKTLPGLQPLRVTVTDPAGGATEYSDYHCAENGAFALPFSPALNDAAGRWTVKVDDLTAGLSAEATVEVR